MEWLNKLSDSIDYLEKHMDSKLDINEVAKVALSSKFHFQRMFHMTTGVTVAEYIRKRRLTLAAQELTTSEVKVIDVALKYGYQTPEAFTKAFQKLHGVTPSEVRELDINLTAYPRISFQIQIKGEKAMNYKIVEKEGFKIVGKSKRIITACGENFEAIPKFWQEVNESGLCEKMSGVAGDLGVLGICMDFDDHQETFNYVIAIEKPEDQIFSDLVEKEIPPATWAIFELIGPVSRTMQDTWERIFSEWFPSTGYEHAEGPEIEIYPPGDMNSNDYKCEIWIPIIKK